MASIYNSRRANLGYSNICKYCPASFVKRSELQGHLDTEHNTDLKFPCRRCTKTYASAAGLRKHKCKEAVVCRTTVQLALRL